MSARKWYKVVSPDGAPLHGGSGTWSLPRGKRPGKWMPRVTGVRCCASGYHVVRGEHVVEWIASPCAIYEAEVRGEHNDQEAKSAYSEARMVRLVGVLDERKLRLFAADCAERVLHLFEEKYPNDKRPREAIRAARKFARGEIDAAAYSAADSAAYSAADSAARSAAYSAADSAARSAAYSAARSAAYSAADSAARSAADSAARSAAYSAARKWQFNRLCWYARKASA